MTLKELINKYVSLTNKKNAEEDKKEEKEEEKKENSDDKDEDDKKEETKENSKGGVDHFQELKNAPEKATFNAPSVNFETMQTQLQRGRDRY